MDFEMLPLPEEVKAQIQKEMDQHHMAVDSFRHDVQRMFEEISKDHLLTLRHLFNHFAQRGDMVYPAYLDGVAAATLHHRFGVCASCGEDHAEQLLKQDGPDSQGQPAIAGETAGEQMELPFPAASERERYERLCIEFGVTQIDNDNRQVDAGRVKCVNCGKEYVNLADRMVKPPGKENCPGCIHKEKWG